MRPENFTWVTDGEKLNFMIKKWKYFLGLVLLTIALLSSGFKTNKTEGFGKLEGFYLQEGEVLNYELPKETDGKPKVSIPYTGKTYVGFKQAIAVRESQGLYKLINPFGYMGKYQFGKSALRAVGIHDTNEFLNNPELQEKAFKALLSINKWELRKEIKKYDGKVVGGIKITESGILAAAHLAGAGSVKKFLRSNGQNGFRDGFGTSLRSYIKKFGGYDTSCIEANRFPQIT